MSENKFNPQDHILVLERKSKKKDAQGHETWTTTKTDYLPVQWRLCWFRTENPKGKIDSNAITIDLEKGAAIFETYVEREDGGSARMHGSETQGDWKDYIEKAQTKSLGRALAAVGYGSQFTDDEFSEGERIVDSPIPHQDAPQSRQNGHSATQSEPTAINTPSSQDARKERLTALYKASYKLHLFEKGATQEETQQNYFAAVTEILHEDVKSTADLTNFRMDILEQYLNSKDAA